MLTGGLIFFVACTRKQHHGCWLDMNIKTTYLWVCYCMWYIHLALAAPLPPSVYMHVSTLPNMVKLNQLQFISG